MQFEYCDTSEKHMRGMQFRQSFPEDGVMVFDVSYRDNWGSCGLFYFHMHNVRFPIAITALDADGVVLALEYIEPETGRFYPPEGTHWVMEMMPGFPASHGVEVGRVFPLKDPEPA